MKKVIILLVIGAVVGIGYFIFARQNITESVKINNEIRTVLADTSISDQMKVWKINDLNDKLVFAYLDEKRPDNAIDILTRKIQENRHFKNFIGKELPRPASSYALEAIYYKELSEAYEQKNDIESKNKALKKRDQAQMMAAKLQPAEDKAKAKREKQEKDALLN